MIKPGRKPKGLSDPFRGEHTDEEWEFVQAVEKYKKSNKKRFLRTSEYYYVMTKILRYRKEGV